MADELDELNRRIEALEALAPRCGVRGCDRVADMFCQEHGRLYFEFFNKHRDKYPPGELWIQKMHFDFCQGKEPYPIAGSLAYESPGPR